MTARFFSRRLWLAVLLFAMLLSFSAIVGTTIYIISQFDGTADLKGWSGRAEEGSRVRCAIVFGAAVHSGDTPGPAIVRRVGTAVRLYREKILQHIIFSGGKGSQEIASEAAVMQSVALKSGIPPSSITIEDHSRSTWENLRNVRPFTGSCSTIIGISDRYHLGRIRFLAAVQAYPGLQTFPSDVDSSAVFEVQSTVREVAAMLYYLPIGFLYKVLHG